MHLIPTPVTTRNFAVRLSVTERCQLRCTYCMPEKGCACSREAGRELQHGQIVRLLGSLHQRHGVRRLRLTGGEPLLRRDLAPLIGELRKLGIDDIALTTNAQLLARDAESLARSGLGRVNISLDSLRPEIFHAMTRGGLLSKTLEGVDAALAQGLGPVRLNMVVMRGANENCVSELLSYALSKGCQLRFLELMPIGHAGARFAADFVSSAEVRAHLLAAGWKLEALPWDFAETSRDYRVEGPRGEQGTCGFISPTTQPFCDGCRRLRITSDGWLYGCLARDVRHDLTPVLEAADEAEAGILWDEVLGEALRSKSGDKYRETISGMSMIGG